MSKRFFYKVYTSGEVDFFDNEQEYVNEKYTCDDVRGLHPMDYWDVVELLNEQQATIKYLTTEKHTDKRFQTIIAELKKENEQLRHEIEIEKKWQLAQDRYYVKIKEENEQLRKELDNFKPIMFNNMQKGTIILYSKGDIDE